MAVGLKTTARRSSLSLEKFIKAQKNLSKPTSKLWPDHHPHNDDDDNNHHQPPDVDDDQGVRTLTLAHPLLRVLDSAAATPKQFNQVHTQLAVSGLFHYPLAAGRAVKRLCSSPSTVSHAVKLFNCLEEPDAFICNTIMRALVNMNDPNGAMNFYYHQMIAKFVTPNHYTFPLLFKMFDELASGGGGDKVHTLVLKHGFELDLFVKNALIHFYFVSGRILNARKMFDESPDSDLVTWNTMIDGYVKNGEVGLARWMFDGMLERDGFSWNSMIAGYVGIGDMEAANDLFDEMPCRDVVSWNCMVDGYARIGNVVAAREFFDRMPFRNVVSWNAVLALYARSKGYDECLRLFDRMMEVGDVEPNEASFMSVLTACAHLGSLDRGKWVHSYVQSNTRIKPDVLLSTALLTMYAKCGAMDLAKDVFDEMPEKSVVSWNSMIMGYGMHGYGDKALQKFLEMERSGMMANDATFVCVLSACTHAGLVLEGWWYFDVMRRVYDIEPKIEHYGCMVDLLARAGLMKDSEELIKKMPVEAGPALWGALLSACGTNSNLELGEIVAKHLIEMEPGDIGPYVLLSNIYAAEGRWEEVDTVRKMMTEKGLQKVAGSSLIHFGNVEIESFQGNESVHRRSMVYSMMCEMGVQMKLSCRT